MVVGKKAGVNGSNGFFGRAEPARLDRGADTVDRGQTYGRVERATATLAAPAIDLDRLRWRWKASPVDRPNPQFCVLPRRSVRPSWHNVRRRRGAIPSAFSIPLPRLSSGKWAARSPWTSNSRFKMTIEGLMDVSHLRGRLAHATCRGTDTRTRQPKPQHDANETRVRPAARPIRFRCRLASFLFSCFFFL